MVMGGAPRSTRFKNQLSGVPNRTTAATCGAIEAGIGPLSRLAGRTRQGRYRWWCSRLLRRLASNRRARFGCRAAGRDRLDLAASVDDSVGGLSEVQRCRVVHAIHINRLVWQSGVKRIHERLPGRANTGRFERAAGEHDFDGGARVVCGMRLCRERRRGGERADKDCGRGERGENRGQYWRGRTRCPF